MADPKLSKVEHRIEVRRRLRAVSPEVLADWSLQLVCRLQARLERCETPGVVALFGGLRNETDLITDLLPWLRLRGWRTVFFAIQGLGLMPYEVAGVHELQRGPLGVWEPVSDLDTLVSLDELTLILVPGLAFSHNDGTRLGHGGGYYDRLLALTEGTARHLGVCYEVQLLPSVPAEAHDVQMPEIITESRLLIF